MKGDVVVMLLNLILKLVKVLVAVTVCDGLVVPTLTLPKARLVGLTSSCPCAAAGSAAARSIEQRRKKLRTENVKMDNFDRGMVIPPMNSAATNVCAGALHHLPIPRDFAEIDSRYEIGAAHYTQCSPTGSIPNWRSD